MEELLKQKLLQTLQSHLIIYQGQILISHKMAANTIQVQYVRVLPLDLPQYNCQHVLIYLENKKQKMQKLLRIITMQINLLQLCMGEMNSIFRWFLNQYQ